MKYILSIVLSITTLCTVFAQKSEVQSAGNHVKYKEWAKAKTAIDNAYSNESTSNYYKMWYYRGKTYIGIIGAGKMDSLDKDAPIKATEAFINAIETDKKEFHTKESKSLLIDCGIALYRSAIMAYQAGDFQRSLDLYSWIFKIFPYDENRGLERNNISEGTIYMNSYFAAAQAGNVKLAKEYLNKLIDMNYNDPNVYAYMSDIYLLEKNNDEAIEYLRQGRDLYPDNSLLMNKQINLYITTGRIEELMTSINDAISYDEYNPNLYLIRARINEMNEKGELAIPDYEKVIELSPSNFEANYSLGAYYFNIAAEKANDASLIINNEAFTKAKKEYESLFNKARPYLETAYSLNPEDMPTLVSLKQLYLRMGETEKFKQISEEIKELQNN